MQSLANEIFVPSYRHADSTAYLLDLGNSRHIWIKRHLTPILCPRVDDLGWLCDYFGWSWHLISHKDRRQALVKSPLMQDPVAHEWDRDGTIVLPEHALLLAMTDVWEAIGPDA